MKRSIIHLDMDAFYAAIEQLDHPEYHGKPVIVGSDPKSGKGRGVVATANYEARKYGVSSALPISQAFRRCPHGIYVRPRMQRYAEISKQVMTILHDFTPLIEKISIDEAFLDITGSLKIFGGATAIGEQIKKRIRESLHLTASIGLAQNKFLAKIASDLEKPDGFTVVKEGDEKSFLGNLQISKLWGVGKKTEMRLQQMGIYTIGQLSELSETELNKKFGKWGLALFRLSKGIDDRPVVTSGVRKSISQERTFDEDTSDEEFIEKTLFRLSEHLSRLMRNSKIKGRCITLKLRLEDFSTFTRSRTLSDFIDSMEILKAVSLELYRKFNKKGKKVRLVGIGVSQLNSVFGEQLALFDQQAPLNKELSDLLDSLKSKFGDDAVGRATLLWK